MFPRNASDFGGGEGWANMKLRSKTALVTGGAVRLGRAICEALAARGCNLAIHYRESGAAADRLAARLRGAGIRAVTVQGRLWSQEDAERVMDEAWKKGGGIDVLINNAAVFHKDTLLGASDEKMLSEWRINALAPMMLTRALALRVAGSRPRRGGNSIRAKVVNLLDRRIAGHETGCLPYVLSKKTLADFTRDAALELAPSITINGVAPGPVLPPPGKGADYVRDLAGKSPLGRAITPRDVAAAVVFLLESDAVTGQIVFVDGGQHLSGKED
jgi:pteridine reductase